MPEFATTIDIEAPPEIVFEHLVTREGLLAWIGQHVELDATPGGVFSLDIEGNLIRGQYLEVDPPHAVVVSWGVLGSELLPPGSSRVEFRLTPTATGTRLDLTHSGLPAEEQPKHAEGWTHFLARLAETAASIR
ncbi:MAG: SRPBCC family protein [Acidimicrobiales bacterium]